MNYSVIIICLILFILFLQISTLKTKKNNVYYLPNSTSNELIYYENSLKSKSSNQLYFTKEPSYMKIKPYDP